MVGRRSTVVDEKLAHGVALIALELEHLAHLFIFHDGCKREGAGHGHVSG